MNYYIKEKKSFFNNTYSDKYVFFTNFNIQLDFFLKLIIFRQMKYNHQFTQYKQVSFNKTFNYIINNSSEFSVLLYF